MDQEWRYSSRVPSQHDVFCCFVCSLVPLFLSALGGVRPQLYADNLKCVASDRALLFEGGKVHNWVMFGFLDRSLRQEVCSAQYCLRV